jgi:hypothetical protein
LNPAQGGNTLQRSPDESAQPIPDGKPPPPRTDAFRRPTRHGSTDMLKRVILLALLAASVIPLAGCRLFHRDCDDRDDRRYLERDCR